MLADNFLLARKWTILFKSSYEDKEIFTNQVLLESTWASCRRLNGFLINVWSVFPFFSWKISVYIELRWKPWGRMIYYLLSLCAWKKPLLSNDKIHNRTWSVSWCYPRGLKGGVSTVCRHTNPQAMLTSHSLKNEVSWLSSRHDCCVGGWAPHIDFCLVDINAHYTYTLLAGLF